MADNVLLTVDEMYEADAAAVSAGVASLDLMEAAGGAIVSEIQDRWESRPVAVLCGPGNNGGDGFVTARLLDEAGWPVRLALLGATDKLTGDAAVNAGKWQGQVEELAPEVLDGQPLVVDALFGAGLARPVEGRALAVIEEINGRKLACVAVDIPSGVHGDSGAIMAGEKAGGAPQATVTVTFFRPKPGHFLLPGRGLAGDLGVADIGIPETVLAGIGPRTRVNGPELWIAGFPWPDAEAHKYTRGHAVVVGGSEMTGAARLAAMGARRSGAGLVTIASPPGAFAVYAAEEPGTLVKSVDDIAGFRDLLGDARKNAVLVGPGAGISADTRDKVLAALETGKAVVVDADGLSVFADDPDSLFKAVKGPCLLTPHEGEFKRLFPMEGDKLSRARNAAQRSGAVVLLKGPDTVIAAPDGDGDTGGNARAVINATGSPDLATAGSGDVLAGMALGLLSQGMDVFDAACASAWLHGIMAERIGSGLIAEDLPAKLPDVLRELRMKAPLT